MDLIGHCKNVQNQFNDPGNDCSALLTPSSNSSSASSTLNLSRAAALDAHRMTSLSLASTTTSHTIIVTDAEVPRGELHRYYYVVPILMLFMPRNLMCATLPVAG